MTEEREYKFRTYKDGDEAGIIELLNVGEGRWRSVEDWNWNYKLSPVFDPSLLRIAEREGKIVGCVLTIIGNLKIGRSVTVKASGGFITVHPDYRRRGIGTNLIKGKRGSRERELQDRGVVITCGSAAPETYKQFYSPLIREYVTIPNDTVVYTKLLNVRPLKRRILSISRAAERDNALKNIDLTMVFHMTGIPSFTVKIHNGRIDITENEVSKPDVRVEGGYDLLIVAFKGQTLGLFKALITGELKIRGLLRNIFKIYKCFKALKVYSYRARRRSSYFAAPPRISRVLS